MPRRIHHAAPLTLLAASAAFAAPPVQHPRTFIIHFDPIVESAGGQRLHDVYNWRDPRAQTDAYIADLAASSHGILQHRITRQISADVYPLKIDGFRYTDASYAGAITSNTFHMPDGVDYNTVVRDYDLARRADFGEVDEVHISGAPYFGYWESTMAGLGGYFVNSGPQQRVASSRLFVIMGFNYERGVAEMLHSTGHRSESIMTEVYGGWSTSITPPRHDWDRFGRNFAQSPGDFALGSVHFPPNAAADYDYGSTLTVTSTAPDWLNFPNLVGQTALVNRETWGGPDYQRNFLKWWYEHIPHVLGRNTHDGYDRLNNWWEYLFNFNEHVESGGDHAPGGEGPVAQPWSAVPFSTGSGPHDDFAPRINDAGRLVWEGFDGNDWEIYSANIDGTGVVQITSNTTDDEAPRINTPASGGVARLVWQHFDGQDYEILSANADGTGLVQITNNAYDDWHADINKDGRLVWDGFDGTDYDIYSAWSDGAGLIVLTLNSTNDGFPRDDVWPRISDADEGGRVVWSSRFGDQWEIFSGDATGGRIVRLTDNAWDDEYPVINTAGRVAWHTWLNNTITDIFSADATGGPVTRVTDTLTPDWYPQIAPDGRLVWMGRNALGPGGAWEILSAPATGGAILNLTCNNASNACTLTHDEHPQIDAAGRIVWQGFDGHDWEIYALISGSTYRLTDNDYDDLAPALSPVGLLTWHGESDASPEGPTTQIFALDLSASPTGFIGTDCGSPPPPPPRDPVVEEVRAEFTLPAPAGNLPSLALAGTTLYSLDGANRLRLWDTLTRPTAATLLDDASEIDFPYGPNPSSVMVSDPVAGRLLVLANNLADPDNAPMFPWRDLSGLDLADPAAGFTLITSGEAAGGTVGDHAASLLTFGGVGHLMHAWLGAPFYVPLNTDGTNDPAIFDVGNRWSGATTEAFADGQTGAAMFYLRQTDLAGTPISAGPLQHEAIYRYDFLVGPPPACGADLPVSRTHQLLPWLVACGDGACVNRHSMEYVPATNRIWVLRAADTNEIGIFDIDDDQWGILRLTLDGLPLDVERADLQLVGDRMFILAAGRSAVYSVDASADGDPPAPACPCEFTSDIPASVNVFDLLAYLDLWFTADSAADLDGAGGVDVFDLLFYLDCWFPASAGAACP